MPIGVGHTDPWAVPGWTLPILLFPFSQAHLLRPLSTSKLSCMASELLCLTGDIACLCPDICVLIFIIKLPEGRVSFP